MMKKSVRSKSRSAKAATPPRAADDTRARLVQAAGEVFAEVGYRTATIRQISARAGTNIALVNYYFENKLGLYTEVLRQAVHATQLETIRATLDQHAPPEEILRQVIRARLYSACGGKHPELAFRIMAHEQAQPTPAMSRVINEVIRPVYKRLREIIGEILALPGDHEKTRLCTHSVMGQIIFYVVARPGLARLWPELKMTPRQLDRIADHIADFSLAYLRESGATPTPPSTRGAKRRK